MQTYENFGFEHIPPAVPSRLPQPPPKVPPRQESVTKNQTNQYWRGYTKKQIIMVTSLLILTIALVIFGTVWYVFFSTKPTETETARGRNITQRSQKPIEGIQRIHIFFLSTYFQ